MHDPLFKLERIADERIARYHAEAEAARVLARARCGWRWRLAEALMALASRLSPAHRTLLQAARAPRTEAVGAQRPSVG